MTDPEFARSHETHKAPRVFAFRKDGMEDNHWDMVNNDVSHCPTRGLATLTSSRLRLTTCERSHLTDDSDTYTLQMFHRAMLGASEISGSLAVLHRKLTPV